MVPRKLATTIVFLAVALGGCAPSPARPDWITEASVSQLRSLGLDPERDVVERGNYHWKWVSRGALVVGGFHCPAGSWIVVSRTITLVGAPGSSACNGPDGAKAELLKLQSDGTAGPLGSF